MSDYFLFFPDYYRSCPTISLLLLFRLCLLFGSTDYIGTVGLRMSKDKYMIGEVCGGGGDRGVTLLSSDLTPGHSSGFIRSQVNDSLGQL